ncbi:MAG: hypothetical protein GY914_10005, partial [Prochlorococcus sp.]|nr:hypothetical protein [Prochlorococcus sp.]
MAVIGKGQVVIEGKDKTAKAFNSAQSRVTRLSGSVKAMGASLIAAFGVRQLTRYGAELLKVHDATNKMAKATGLSAETIEEFRHALELSGLSATQADSGLRTFVKRVGELKTEQGAAYTALKKFDEGLLAALQTAGSTEEAMQIAAKAIQSIDDPMQKAAISSALFSKKVGVDLTAALQGGEQGLWDLMKASREAIGEGLGAESRAKIERFNDEITNAKAAFQNVASHILVELLPALLSFSGWLTGTALPAVKDFIATIKDWWAASEDVRKVVGVTLVTALNLVMGVIGAVGNIVVTVTDEFNAWATGAKDAGEAIKSVIKRVKNE